MFHISRTVLHAIQALLYLGKVQRIASCGEMHKEMGCPQRYMLQIMRKLVLHDTVVAVRGVTGGYLLDKPLSQISLLEIIEAIEGPVASHLHFQPYGPMPVLEEQLQRVASEFRQSLASVTLDLLASDVSFETLCPSNR